MSSYPLTEEQIGVLRECLSACYSIPFISDVEGFVWEAIFHHIHGLPIPDQIDGERKKSLFDAVDSARGIGWSLKTLLWHSAQPGTDIQFIIQRADVLKKGNALGFPGLTINSDPDDIGGAILQHWRRKLETDSLLQGVKDARVAILIKNRSRRKVTYIEHDLYMPEASELRWTWSRPDVKTALWGIHKTTGCKVYRWYSNQKQLFEGFTIQDNPINLDIIRELLEVRRFLEAMRDLHGNMPAPASSTPKRMR